MTKSGRVTKKISVFNIVNALIMILLTVLFVLPFWLIVTASLSSNSILMREGFSIFFRGFTFAGYKFLFSIGDAFLRALFVTVAVAVAAAAISVFGCTWAAFALSNKKLVGRKFFNVFFMIPMFFSGGTIPTYLVIRGIGLYDTIWALIIPGSIGAYNILLLRNYFYGLSPSLGEAAQLDGANDFQQIRSVYTPLALPMMFTVGMITFVGKWNSWLPSVLYLEATHTSLQLAQHVLKQMIDNMQAFYSSHASGSVANAPLTSARNAGIVIVILPLILVSPILQKYFVGGITAGAEKG